MKDLSHWYTKETAALALNCSTKTLERLVSQGRIHTELWKRPAGAAISVYHPKDIAKERELRNPGAKPFVMPPTAEPAIPAPQISLTGPDVRFYSPPSIQEVTDPGRELVRNIPQSIENTAVALSDVSKTLEALGKLHQNAATLPVDRKLFLSRREAAEYTGLPKSTIVAAINAGICKAVRTGRGIRVMRESLDSLELAAFLDTLPPPAPRPGPPGRPSKGDLLGAAAAANLVVPGVEPTD